MKSRRILFARGAAALGIGLACLGYYSYRSLLMCERRFMPDLAERPTPHERRVTFRLVEMGTTWMPHWKVAYHERTLTNTTDVDPSLSVDLFGRIVDSSSKEVALAIETHQLWHGQPFPPDWTARRIKPMVATSDRAAHMTREDKRMAEILREDKTVAAEWKEARKRDWAEWSAFLLQMKPGDELWFFSSPASHWAGLSGREGYAIVRAGRERKRFVTRMN